MKYYSCVFCCNSIFNMRKPKNNMISVRFNDDMLTQVQGECEILGIDRAEFIRQAVSDKLNSNNNQLETLVTGQQELKDKVEQVLTKFDNAQAFLQQMALDT